MTSDEDAEKAIYNLNGTILMDKDLIIKEARPQTHRGQRDNR